MSDLKNSFTINKFDPSNDQKQEILNDKPQTIMNIESLLDQPTPRNFTCRFDVHSPRPGYSFDPIPKWPNKTIKKYLLNYKAVKSWITHFEFIKEGEKKGYHFLINYEDEKELRVLSCHWGPNLKKDLSDFYKWQKDSLKEGKQITLMVNPEDPYEVHILGVLEIYSIENDKPEWIAETDWSKT